MNVASLSLSKVQAAQTFAELTDIMHVADDDEGDCCHGIHSTHEDMYAGQTARTVKTDGGEREVVFDLFLLKGSKYDFHGPSGAGALFFEGRSTSGDDLSLQGTYRTAGKGAEAAVTAEEYIIADGSTEGPAVKEQVTPEQMKALFSAGHASPPMWLNE